MIIEIISATTGLIVSIYVLFKTIKYIRTPCFTYESEDGQQQATLIQYVIQKMTPRSQKANKATTASSEINHDVEPEV